MAKQHTSIEAKMQADYDAISQAFYLSRKDKHWVELDEMIAKIKDDDKILDMGCGIGRVCMMLKNPVKYTGIDISGKAIEKAKQSCPDGEFIQGSVTDLPFDDMSFDVVLFIATLPHLISLSDRSQALKQAHRVLKLGGILNISVMSFWRQRYWQLFFKKSEGLKTLSSELQKQIGWADVFLPWQWETRQKVYRYYHAFRKQELKRLIEQAGFKIQSIDYVRNGKKVNFYQANNIVAIAQKMV